jgi:LCP family protein required for cell wall assembly
MNVLVMGLESRTDYQGDLLDHHMQVVLHSGSGGSQDTNTLILIHIFADGRKAVGFSIPRDSLVDFPQAYDGNSRGKIDAAYAWAYVQYLSEHAAEDKQDRYLHANQAGQAAAIATVQSVTGVHIDHFLEVNLEGFYYLAQAFGGIEVCVMPAPASMEPAAGMGAGANLTDKDVPAGTDNSGFDAIADGYNLKKGGEQYLHLSPAQSLAFVRSRDTLPGVDIGRTARQQAAIDYVVYQLKHAGVLSDFSKLNSLAGTARKYLITDSQLNLLDFATNMRALSGQDLSFTTLPGTPVNGVILPAYGTYPQDVIEIDVPKIQQIVKAAFAGKPAGTATGKAAAKKPSTSATLAPGKITVDVYNGSTVSTAPLAGDTSAALVALGYKAGQVANATAQKQPVQAGTQVFYGVGAGANAAELAPQFGTKAIALKSLPARHIEVLIGSSVTTVPAGLTPSSTATQRTQSVGAEVFGARLATAAHSGTRSATASPAGGIGSVTVAPNAKYGIPCVY